jgi:hypothetical protein
MGDETMSLLKNSLLAAALVVFAAAPAAAQMKDGSVMIVTSKGESKTMRTKDTTVPAGFTEVKDNLAIIMVGGKTYMKPTILDREYNMMFIQ